MLNRPAQRQQRAAEAAGIVHPTETTPAAPADLLHGHKEIAKFLGLTPRQVSWYDEQGILPTLKIGRAVCARKSKLIEWVEGLEIQRRDARSNEA